MVLVLEDEGSDEVFGYESEIFEDFQWVFFGVYVEIVHEFFQVTFFNLVAFLFFFDKGFEQIEQFLQFFFERKYIGSSTQNRIYPVKILKGSIFIISCFFSIDFYDVWGIDLSVFPLFIAFCVFFLVMKEFYYNCYQICFFGKLYVEDLGQTYQVLVLEVFAFQDFDFEFFFVIFFAGAVVFLPIFCQF